MSNKIKRNVNNYSKNIAFLIPNLKCGGSERIISGLSRAINKNIKKYFILHSTESINYEFKGFLIDLALDSRWYIHYFIGIFKGSYKLKRIKEKNNILTTISFLSESNQINLLSSFISNIDEKIILSVRSFKSKTSKHFILKIIEKYFIKLFYNKANMIVAVSQGVKSDLIENFGIKKEKVKIIYNACNIEKIEELSKEKLTQRNHLSFFKNEVPVIINVGNLKKVKGQYHLIRAFKNVLKIFPECKLLILGGGALENYLVNLVNNLKLKENVFFLGLQNNPFKFLSRSDLFVMSSLSEGFPNVVTEAMACNLPIISTDCKSGPREILAPNTNFKKELKNKIEYAEFGILTPVCDGNLYNAKIPLTKEEKLLAEAIIKVLKNDDLKKNYREQSIQRIKDFRFEKITREWMDLL